MGPKLPPRSGYEPKYRGEEWSRNAMVQATHNCYSYFLDDLRVHPRAGKPQPGLYAMGPGYNREELITGINTDLARQGLSSDDYYKFNQTLREQDANAYDAARPFSSGQTARNFAQIAPGFGMVSRGVESIYDSIKDFATAGPDETSENDSLIEMTEIEKMNKGGIIHAADGVFAESETIEMPLTMPEIKRHRKKLEAGFQYDVEIDGRNKSFSFDEQIGPSGIAALRERESITPTRPDLNYRANGGYMSSFPNQNLNTESLSASDNIDDRIMKNLEFEKMAPGMMGYNMGGVVEPVAPDFNTGI